MVITKSDDLFKILKNIQKESKTPKCSTVVRNVQFIKNKGIVFKFSENIRYLYYYNTDVDFTTAVSNFVIEAILACFETADEVSINYTDIGGVSINGCINVESSNESVEFVDINNDLKFDLIFTKEQFDKLENDFIYTIGNNFYNPKTTDTIGFAVNSGELYKLRAGINIYSISKFDATINNATMEQNYGHNNFISLMPRKVFDLVAGDTVYIKIQDANENTIIKTNKMHIVYNIAKMNTGVFLERLKKFNSDSADNGVKIPNALKNLKLNNFVKNYSEESEDNSVVVNLADSTVSLFNSCNLNFQDAQQCDYKISTNLQAFSFLLDNISEDSCIKEMEDGSCYYIKNNEVIYFFVKNNI